MSAAMLQPAGLLLFSLLGVVTPSADWEPWPDSCETLSPGNGIPPQTSPLPWNIKVDDDKVLADGCVYITLEGNETNEFAGFMVQTRNESNIPIGLFRPATDVKLMTCFGAEDNTAININYLPKEDVTIRWFPEEKDQGHTVRVVATIARDYLEKEYWLRHESIPIKILPPKYPTMLDR